MPTSPRAPRAASTARLRARRSIIALALGFALSMSGLTPVHASYPVAGAIGNLYRSLGGAGSALGQPTGPERCTLRNSGCFQEFRGGSIHWTQSTGAHATWGGIRTAWRNAGWENGKLGYPTSGERCTLRGGGCFQEFQGGSVHWSPGNGAHATWGGIRTAWRNAGWENGKLGYPTSGERCTLRGGGCFQEFQGGSVHWSPGNGAHATWGGIRTAWRNAGWENGKLGYPTSGERCTLRGGGCFQEFQGGSVHWSPGNGAHATWGGIRTAWRNAGWENGSLGYPTSGEYSSGGGVRQDFEGGYITWRSGEGARVHVQRAPSSFRLEGRGFGHGVGMSQYGAQGMAAQGRSATQILEHYYNPAKVEEITARADDDIRVQLLADRSSITITPSGGRLRVKAGPTTVASSGQITVNTSGSQVRASIDGRTVQAGWITVEWEGTRYWSGSAATVGVSHAQSGSTGTYRHGRIEVRRTGGNLNVINVLKVNSEYLPGVAEVPNGWRDAALQAQAIAARTYAYRNMASVKSACECHVYDEVQSQVFRGWNQENAAGNWVRAVRATQTVSGSTVTRARVVRHNGALIDAVYSSSSGGRTNPGADVWGSNTPYLQSRDDSAAHTAAANNPYSSWTATISQSDMARAFGLSDVVSIQVANNSAGSMVRQATATSSTGQTATRSGTQLRTSLGLRSATFTVN
ncbi:SpoIID/LytB domain-containing protein [Sediminivirga luteola]|uniref:SpoIID/LytB domain-containing protein n=1 Tax=Sediminivirga luteola TaxID=1774748 RepID=UPI001F015726|nr:SpoIID/LytB domain-containing protein [Sediminivirga luteola]